MYKKGNTIVFVIFFVVLALAGGFYYLGFRNQKGSETSTTPTIDLEKTESSEKEDSSEKETESTMKEEEPPSQQDTAGQIKFATFNGVPRLPYSMQYPEKWLLERVNQEVFIRSSSRVDKKSERLRVPIPRNEALVVQSISPGSSGDNEAIFENSGDSIVLRSKEKVTVGGKSATKFIVSFPGDLRLIQYAIDYNEEGGFFMVTFSMILNSASDVNVNTQHEATFQKMINSLSLPASLSKVQ